MDSQKINTLTLYPTQSQAIDKALMGLLEKLPARFILLADVNGQTIATAGNDGAAFDLAALGSLIASDFAASQELSRLSGEVYPFQMILREGREVNTWTIDAGAYLVLMVKVSSSVPLGWCRLVIRRGAEIISEIALTSLSESSDVNLELGSSDLAEQISSSLDELWQL